MKKALLPLFVVGLSAFAFAGSQTFTIDFEEYPAYTQITNQYSASDFVNFTNALQLVAPDYDYFDYPAHSGNGVITNDPGDPVTLTFSSLIDVTKVTGWYTDPNGITVTAYNSSNQVIGTVSEAGIIGANAQFTLAVQGGGIAYITIGDSTGQPDSETLDDISFTTLAEPNALLLVCSGLMGTVGLLRRKRASKS